MTAFFFVLNLLLLFRILAFFLDDQVSRREAIAATLALPAILSLFFRPSLALWALQLCVVVTVILSWLGDRRPQRIPIRLGVLLIQVIVVGFFSSPSFGLRFRADVRVALDTWPHYFWPLSIITKLANAKAQAYVTGLLVCIQEANLVVRWIIESLDLKPAGPSPDAGSAAAPASAGKHTSSRDYSRGRVIGTLERVAVYVLVLQGQYEALGLVLAAKGLARFQNLDDREFAEYFLIGTFLSVVLAGGIALGVRAIL
jgi:hypothetical protein